jgi:hypothetical protein
MTLAPVNQPVVPSEEQAIPEPMQGLLSTSDLEILADKLIEMIKRELQIDNDREGRQA